MNAKRDIQIQIQNFNEELPIDFSFDRAAYFHMMPSSGIIPPETTMNVICSYIPTGLGSFSLDSSFYLLSKSYQIPLKLYGTSSNILDKINESNPKKIRGLEASVSDFTQPLSFIEDGKYKPYQAKRRAADQSTINASMSNLQPNILQNLEELQSSFQSQTKLMNTSIESTQIDQFLSICHNKKKYNDYLKTSRMERAKKVKETQLKQKMNSATQQAKDMHWVNKKVKEEVEEEEKDEPPHDFYFEFGMERKGLASPKLPITKSTELLYVTKPVGHYEPNQSITEIKRFVHNPNTEVKKVFPGEARSHAEIRDCSCELTGEELQKVFADPIRVKFGQIFIKSSKSQTFAIRNDLRTSIMVCIAQLEVAQPELKQSNTKPQIIPPGQVALFEVVFFASQLLKFNDYIKYIINGKHVFQINVEGEVIPARLDFQLNSSFMKFTFPEDSTEMEMEQSLKILNTGNAPVKFVWLLTVENKLFTVTPLQGQVEKESSFTVQIKYKPQMTSGGKTEEEKLVMKVEDGFDQIIKVIGQCNEGRLINKDAIFKDGIHLGQISVSKRIETILWIKNSSRQPTVYEVDDKLPLFVEILPKKSRIGGDDVKALKIVFYATEETEIKDQICLNIRGSKPLIFPFSVEAIIPQLQILQESFEFGKLTTHGLPGTLPLTIQNNSNIVATLLLDLRDLQNLVPGLRLLQISLDASKNQTAQDSEHPLLEQIEDDSNTIASRQGERQQQQVVQQQQSGNFSHQSSANTSFSSEFSTNEHEKQASSRNYKLNISAHKNVYYQLTFCPVEPIAYHFELPLLLSGLGRLPSLTRVISVEGLPPQLTITPTTVQFPKKIILGTDKSVPTFQDLALNNETSERLEWFIPEDALSQEHSKIFIIQPDKGVLEPYQSIPLKIGFNPIRAEECNTKIPIYTNSVSQQPQFELQVSGQGVFPKLLFDRHYVILPIVPLGVTSKCTFRIINDGYENLNLMHNIPNDASLKADKIDLNITYPDGKNLGITKSKIRVDIAFVRKRPLSFTTKLEFIDDQGWTYSIQISASTDNSILTNFSYLYRCKDEYKIYAEENRPITLIEEFADEDTGSSLQDHQSSNNLLNPAKLSKNPTAALSQKSSAKSSLGYHPISINILENLAKGISHWLKCFAVQTPIQAFPADVITNHGAQIFELVQYLTGKYPTCKAKLETAGKKQERVEMLIKQYDDLIRSLKENGAQLNTLRPQYLLSFHDYIIFTKTQSTQEQTLSSRSTLSEPKFNYISLDSWIMVFHQIIKIYLLARVNQKPIKQFPINLPEFQTIPEYYLDTSNIYTQPEIILLRWMEIHYNIAHPHSQKRFTNFDSDLKNGLVFQALLLNYVNTASLKLILNLKQVCTSEEDYKYNAEKILLGLQEIGLQTHVDANDLAYPSGPSLLLFLLHLFFTLPHYIPKQPPLLFSCVLGESTIKTLQLSNPTQKPISYNVKYEGHPDFIISDDSVKLEPKSVTNFKILFQSRISEAVSGRLIFTNKRESNFQAAPLVFELKSNITDRTSIESWTVETPLYSCLDKRIDVTNIFTSSKEEYADFQIKLIPILPSREIINPLTTFQEQESSTKKKKKQKKLQKQTVPVAQTDPMPAFFCPRDWIRIKRGDTQPLIISFLPFSYHIHQCKIVFCDSNVGEFQHEMIGTPLFPEPLPQEIKPNILIYAEANNPAFEAVIHFRNDLLVNAKKILENRLNQTGKMQLKEQFKKFFKTEFPDQQTFSVEISPQTNFQNIIIPQSLTVCNPYIDAPTEITQDKKKKNKQQLDQSFESKKSKDSTKVTKDFIFDEKLENNKLPIQFVFRQPELNYKCNIILKNETLTDIRIYKLACQVIAKPVKATIEMRVACGEELKQDIPFVNNTDKDWQIKANFIQLPEKFGFYFNGPKELSVKHKSTTNYQLTFKPLTLVKQAEAKLQISNPFTHDQYEYDLIGHAEEPLAKEHIVMNCVARQVAIQNFVIQNPYPDQEVRYRVETDLINPEGEPDFTIPPGQSYNYKLIITPLMGGIYTGQITFIEVENEAKYIWYTLCINTSRPRMEKPIELNSVIRKTVAFDISIRNPLSHPTTFEAIIEGSPYLSGSQQFTIQPGHNSTYELLFTPLMTFNQLKGSLSFLNQELGEIWYGLVMNSTEAPVQKLPTIKAELGKQSTVELQLENPSQYQVQVHLTNSNPENFSLKDQQNVKIEPFSIKTVEIVYTPSELDVNVSAELNFVTEEIGQWEFLLYGVGIPPTEYPLKKIESLLNNEETSMIAFKNPFKDAIPVIVSIESTGEQNKQGWNLLLKKTKLVIPGFQLLQIPFSFNPREINDYSCVVVIYMNEKIQWRFPVQGLAECAAYTTTFNYKTKCRIPLETQLRISLQGLPSSLYKENTEEEFYIELENVPEKDKNLINRCLELRPIKKTLRDPQEQLVYNMSFSPMKPLNTAFDMCVFRKLGGLWKFKMFLEATVPDVDDIITIHSPLNQTTSVSFKLSNKYKQFSPFVANFLPDSAPEFSVMPRTGELAPMGREGKNFIISFTPIEYSKAKTGMLIIQTDELYWSFLIKGTFPQYIPPQVPISIIDDHLDSGYLAQKSDKNFLLHNIKSSKFPTLRHDSSIEKINKSSRLKVSQQIKNSGSNLSSIRKSMF